jgi:prepilin-type N-terminal cleavage/methylation domain-containing protein
VSKYGTGFTLIELIAVVLILGIIAAIGAPKVINVTTSARDRAAVQSLHALREAIDLYFAHNSGRFPGADGNEASFKNDVSKFLGRFPKCPVGTSQNAFVAMDKNGPVMADGNPTKGWKYFYEYGVFIINSRRPTESDPSVAYDEL